MSSWADPSHFFNSKNRCVLLVVLYVHDSLVTGNIQQGIENIITEFRSTFTIRTCSDMNAFLGM